jgi:8-oxo-dGTP diphosphatase
VLRVAAAAVVEERRLLLVSKRAAPDVFYLPGGKLEPGETADDCVRREVSEELGVTASSLAFFETVTAVAAIEGVPMEMKVFLATVDGEPAPAAEIAELAWYEDAEPFNGRLAPAIAGCLLPGLRRRGLL